MSTHLSKSDSCLMSPAAECFFITMVPELLPIDIENPWNEMKWNYFFRGWNVKIWSWNDLTSLRRKWQSLCTPCILTGRRIWFASRHRSITRWVDYYRLWYHGVHTLQDSTIDEHIATMYFLPIVLRTITLWYTYQVNLLVYMLYVFIVCMLIPAGGNSQPWLTQLFLVWRHQAITWTNVD